MKTLVVYFSKYGQTQSIAHRIGKSIEVGGSKVDVVDVKQALSMGPLDGLDAFIVGSPIYVSRHSKEVAEFINKNLQLLNQKHTGFFSVSLAASGDDSQRQEAIDCMNRFLESCNWQPTTTKIVAGAVHYRKYGWLTRWLMKRIVRKAGGNTDTSQNHEFTDWEDVNKFGERFLAELNKVNE